MLKAICVDCTSYTIDPVGIYEFCPFCGGKTEIIEVEDEN